MDIGLFLTDKGFDITIDKDDLKADAGLETAVAISIFTDRRVTDDDLPDMERSKRGWWGDMVPEQPNDQIGSRLWLVEREKITNEVLRRSEELIEEGLDWMIEDGVANDISATSYYNIDKHLISEVEIQRPDQDAIRYQVLWESQELRRM